MIHVDSTPQRFHLQFQANWICNYHVNLLYCSYVLYVFVLVCQKRDVLTSPIFTICVLTHHHHSCCQLEQQSRFRLYFLSSFRDARAGPVSADCGCEGFTPASHSRSDECLCIAGWNQSTPWQKIGEAWRRDDLYFWPHMHMLMLYVRSFLNNSWILTRCVSLQSIFPSWAVLPFHSNCCWFGPIVWQSWRLCAC